MDVPSESTDQRGKDDADRLTERLHAEHGAALYGWAVRRMADRRDAEEIVAETLVRAWRRYDQFDPTRGSERAWIFGIAHNAAADAFRRTRRHLRVVDDEAVFDVLGEDEIDRVAEASLVRDALAELPEHQRVVIVEGFFFGRTSTEIADVLGVPPGTVKSRMYYGMRALRSVLEERGVL
jgi:RNA polymerase sigma-70 factor, ECF subfamily